MVHTDTHTHTHKMEKKCCDVRRNPIWKSNVRVVSWDSLWEMTSLLSVTHSSVTQGEPGLPCYVHHMYTKSFTLRLI